MKALQYKNYGGSAVLEINEVEKPIVGKGQVLIEVHAASINPFDYKLRLGYMKDGMPLQFPFTIGGDLSGVVTAVGEEVNNFKIGDEVFGQSYNFGGSSGSMAQFAAANIDSIAQKPANIDHNQAASLPLVGSSAIQALEDHMNLQSGQKILIHGGAGGIGSIAIQLAKHLGAYVATTASAKDIDFVKGLGADKVIDYTQEKFEEKLSGFDAVYDTVDGDTTERSFKVLKKRGILVSMLGKPSEELAVEYGVTVVGQGTKTDSEHLTKLAQLIEQGAIKPQVDKIFPFEQSRAAFEYAENNHPRGKVVIKIND